MKKELVIAGKMQELFESITAEKRKELFESVMREPSKNDSDSNLVRGLRVLLRTAGPISDGVENLKSWHWLLNQMSNHATDSLQKLASVLEAITEDQTWPIEGASFKDRYRIIQLLFAAQDICARTMREIDEDSHLLYLDITHHGERKAKSRPGGRSRSQ